MTDSPSCQIHEMDQAPSLHLAIRPRAQIPPQNNRYHSETESPQRDILPQVAYLWCAPEGTWKNDDRKAYTVEPEPNRFCECGGGQPAVPSRYNRNGKHSWPGRMGELSPPPDWCTRPPQQLARFPSLPLPGCARKAQKALRALPTPVQTLCGAQPDLSQLTTNNYFLLRVANYYPSYGSKVKSVSNVRKEGGEYCESPTQIDDHTRMSRKGRTGITLPLAPDPPLAAEVYSKFQMKTQPV
ncbi:hypothetical protein DFH94DRAFT_847199 [Russula ochroleuca]|uniref:Uncharacterized protein n=1 Tax=Russula ochroleuca TaxID=152965 RepID=A0A9P5K068_9AGAM|nr:hypothetical protein DFH94DRAFT_847199 [Russula ochroleuca]